MKDKIKLIAIDFDGTFLDNSHLKSDLSYIEKLREMQLSQEIVFASGRATAGILILLEKLGIKDLARYIIGHNGAEIYDLKEEKVIYQDSINDETVFGILELLEKEKIKNPLSIHDWDKLITYNYDKRADLECWANFTTCVKIDDIHKFPKNKLKLMIFATNQEVDYIYNLIDKSEYGDKVTQARSVNILVEITDKNVNKFTALEVLCKKLGISVDDVLAFGNAENDVEMITGVGYGYAMKNSEEHLLKVAKRITKFTNDERGVEREIIDILGN